MAGMTTDTLPALAGIFATAFAVGLSGAMMPGPLLAYTIGDSARRGARSGPLMVFGHMLLEAALVAAVAAGLGTVLSSPRVVTAISLVGGAMMGWMGATMLRASRRISLDGDAGAARRGMHPVVAGIVVSLANPYWTLWWATIGLTYIAVGMKAGLPGLLAFFAGHIASDLAWYSFVSVAIARGRRLMPPWAYRGLIGLCAVIMLVFGALFLAGGVGGLCGRP